MITNRDLYKEQKEREKVINDAKATELEVAKANLKASDIIIKLLHNIRTNSVTIMKHFKIEPVQPKKDDQEKSSKDS